MERFGVVAVDMRSIYPGPIYPDKDERTTRELILSDPPWLTKEQQNYPLAKMAFEMQQFYLSIPDWANHGYGSEYTYPGDVG